MSRSRENPFSEQSKSEQDLLDFYKKFEKHPFGIFGKYATIAAIALSTQACGRFMANVPGIGGAENDNAVNESPSERFKMHWQTMSEGLYLPETGELDLKQDKANEKGGVRLNVDFVKIKSGDPRPDEPSCITHYNSGESIGSWIERGYSQMVYFSNLTDSYNLKIADSRQQGPVYVAADTHRLDQDRPIVDAWSRNTPTWLYERFAPTSPPIDYRLSEAQPNIQPTDLNTISRGDEQINSLVESAAAMDALGNSQGHQRAEVFHVINEALSRRKISGLITLEAPPKVPDYKTESDTKEFSFVDRSDAIINTLLSFNRENADRKLDFLNRIITSTPAEQGIVQQKDLRFLISSNQPSSRFIGRIQDVQIILPFPIPDPNIDKDVWQGIETGMGFDPMVWQKMSQEEKDQTIRQKKEALLAERQQKIDQAKEIKLQAITTAMNIYLIYIQELLRKKYGEQKYKDILKREVYTLGTEVDNEFMFKRLGDGHALMVLRTKISNPLIEPTK